MPLFTSILNWLEAALSHGGYSIMFIVSMLEAAPLVGSFVPGHALIIIAGFLTRIGVLNFVGVCVAAASGAVLGDIIGYMIGKRYGFDFLVRFGRYFFLKERHLKKARTLMDKHTGVALIIGRFNPVTRALTPFLAGATNLNLTKFWFFNIIGGVSWAVSSVFLGYLFGASYEVATKYIGKFLFIATVLSILIVWGYQFINSRRHIFAKYQLFTLIINIFSLYVFFKIIDDTLSQISSLAELDVWVNLKMIALETPWLVSLMSVITDTLSPAVLLTIGALLMVVYALRKQWYTASLFFIGLGGVGLINGLVKVFVERVRPENAVYHLSDYSFPSGHAAISVVFFSILMYLLGTRVKNLYFKELLGTLCIFAFVLVGFSRIYLNVHWLSDVIGGYALGLFWLTLTMLGLRFAESVIRGSKE